MPPSGWEQVRRVLVVRLDNIGDVIMLGPALRALRAALPGAHVTLMASHAGAEAAPLLPWIDEVMTARVVWQDASRTMRIDAERENALVERVRAGRFDAAADDLLRDAGIDRGDRFIAVAPTASCEARTYPLDRFTQVIDALPASTDLPVVVVGSRRDDCTLRDIAGERVSSLVGRTSVPQLAAIIRRSALSVVNNSAPLHLADAFGRPAVVLYSGSEYEEQWRPRSSRARLFTRPTSCSPCYRFTCAHHMECLDIPPGHVVAACVEMLRDPAPVARQTPTRPAWRIVRRQTGVVGGLPA